MTALELVMRVLRELLRIVVETLPRVLAGLGFLLIAFVGIRLAQRLVRRTIDRVYPDEGDLIASFGSLLLGVVLWFGALLMLLDILGMGQIAASLGTAAGFAALGVSYALSNMLADAVAGVYLLRDPDFEPGDTVTTEGITGEVAEIGLRKSRLQLPDGDVVVLANRDVEKRWTKEDGPAHGG